MTKREYSDYIQDILNSIAEIKSFIGKMNYSEFLSDQKTINAVIRSLEVIGEAVKKLPEEIKKKQPSVPWKSIAGMRDKLIHDYFGIDLEILWLAATKDIPSIKSNMKKLKTRKPKTLKQ